MDYIYENDDLLREVQTNTSIIPANTISFAEDAMYVAEAIESEFNKLFESVGINELAVYESTGEQIVYEGERLTNFKEQVINLWKKIWGGIKGAFENAIAKFMTLTKKSKENIVNKINVDELPEKSYGKVHTFPRKFTQKPGMYIENANQFASYVVSEFEKVASSSDEEKTKVKTDLEAKICSKVYNLGDSGVGSVSDLIDLVKKDWMGEEIEADKAFVKENFKEMSDLVLAGNAVKSIKVAYKGARKFIDERIKEARKFTDDKITIAKAEVSVLKSISQCAVSANSAVLTSISRQYNEYRNVLVKCALVSKKAKEDKKETKEETTHESVIATQMDLIESAFNW